MSVSFIFIFFSCVYLPLKVAGGCTARISLQRFRDPSSRLVRTLDGRVPDCPRSAVSRNKNGISQLFAARTPRLESNRTTGQSRFLSRRCYSRVYTPLVAYFPSHETRASNRYGNIYNGQRSMFALTEGIPRGCLRLIVLITLVKSKARPRNVWTRQQFDALQRHRQLSLATRWSDAVYEPLSLSLSLSLVSYFFSQPIS